LNACSEGRDGERLVLPPRRGGISNERIKHDYGSREVVDADAIGMEVHLGMKWLYVRLIFRHGSGNLPGTEI